jgi:hypothetical protein
MLCRIKEAPLSYDGTLEGLYSGWAKHVLLAPSIVEEFHKQFCVYLGSADPLFLVRTVGRQERGHTLRTEKAARLRPTDNAPAWWIHYQLFSGQFKQYASFGKFIESAPCHMFDVRLPDNINQAGWHVAHIFDVKDRNVDFHQWHRNELTRRMARNIHPCNYFYIPKREWQRHGGNRRVIAFFYDKFESLYRTIWKDFLKLVDGVPVPISARASEYPYSFSAKQPSSPIVQTAQPNRKATLQGCISQYSHPRLCFKADVIEPLDMDDRFCIVTDQGTFAMTKREFYETFPRVLESRSYRQGRIYHYPKPPQRALRFKINFEKTF